MLRLLVNRFSIQQPCVTVSFMSCIRAYCIDWFGQSVTEFLSDEKLALADLIV